SGTVVADGDYELSFSLYDVETGGTALWGEIYSSVPVTEGVFHVILGSLDPLSLNFDRQYWLGVTVGGDTEFSPRIQLTSSPYSLNSQSILGSTNTFPSDGDVGIGTTSPGATLQVGEGGVDASLDIYTSTQDVGGTRAIRLIKQDATANWGSMTLKNDAIEFGGAGTIAGTLRLADGMNLNLGTDQKVTFGDVPGSFAMTAEIDHDYIDNNNGKLNFNTKQSGTMQTVMHLDNAGNVGIGTESPEDALHVAGNIRLGTQPSRITFKTTGNDEGVIEHLEETESQGQLRIAIGDDGEATDNIAFGYYWYEDQSWKEQMRIQMDGNVGIGTTGPAQKLSVAGTIESTSGGFKFPDGTTQTTASTGGASSANGWVDDGTVVRLETSTDYVGIGTTSPDSPLHIESNQGAGSTTPMLALNNTAASGQTMLDLKDEGTTKARLRIAGGGNAFFIQGESSSDIRFVTGDNVRMTVGTDGNVGIGTTSPNSTFETNGSFATSAVKTITNADYTATASDYVILMSNTTTQWVFLPTAIGIEGRRYIIKKINAGGMIPTIDPSGSETIDGSEFYSGLDTENESVEVISDGSNWFIIGQYRLN
ncbi:MAG: hypothetical protein V3T99_02230, partial [Nitrososphaerales archaeon]